MTEIELDAFVDATRLTFETMLGVEVAPGAVRTGRGAVSGFDVSGIVALGWTRDGARVESGAVVLSLPGEVARRVVGWILGADELPELDRDVADGIGEIANVIAGRAKQDLARAGVNDCATALPVVVLGAQHPVFRRHDAVRHSVEFHSEAGPFVLQVVAGVPARRPSGATCLHGREES